MQTSHQASRLAIASAKASIAATDAAFTTSINLPPTLSPSMSAGQMLLAVTKAGDFSAHALSRKTLAIKGEMKTKMDAAASMLDQAGKTAVAFEALADYLQGKSSVPPEGLPQPVIDAARTVKRAAESGLYQPKSLSDEVRRHATAALVMLADSKKTLARVKSAGQVAFQHRAWQTYAKAASHDGYSRADRKRLEMTEYRYEALYRGHKRRHAERYFEAVELSKTYRGIELKHTGVEVGR